MKIISTNIRFKNPLDEEHNWPFRKPSLRTIIDEFSPDIICSQEGREPQLREFSELIQKKIHDTHRQWIEERMYPCIYSNEQNLNSGDIWLSQTPNIAGSKSFDSSFPRLATWVSFKNFLLVNTHFDHVLESTRLEQARVLAQEIKKLQYENLILCGDFNSTPGSKVHQYLQEKLKLTDAWDKEEYSSHHKFTGQNPEGARIDWFLHSEKIKVQAIDFDRRSIEGIYPSDHFPLLVEFKA